MGKVEFTKLQATGNDEFLRRKAQRIEVKSFAICFDCRFLKIHDYFQFRPEC